MNEFFLPVRVYIEDTDAGGIVYYVNYLKFMERARTEFMRQLGYGKTAIFNDNAMFVVASSSIDYLAPARLDDELRVTAQPVKTRRASVIFEQRVLRGEHLLCRGDVRIACVDRATQSPCPMPDAMFEEISRSMKPTVLP